MAGSDLFTGTLDVLILKALEDERAHGYAIAQWIRRRSDDVLTIEEGALYPALHRLERKKLIGAEWGLSDTNRDAKFYQLTAAGRRHLDAELARWDRHSAAVSAVLRGRAGGSSPSTSTSSSSSSSSS